MEYQYIHGTDTVADIARKTNENFNGLEEKFNDIDNKFNDVDEKFNVIGDVGSVKTVNDKFPDENGNIELTAEDIGVSSGGINPNLLDNWYFGNPVNQRGQTEYMGAGYTIDRWFAHGNTTINIVDDGIELTATGAGGASFEQRIEGYKLQDNQIYTISLLTSNGELFSYFFQAVKNGIYINTIQLDNAYIAFQYDTASDLWHMQIIKDWNDTPTNFKIKAIKLEPGAVQTLVHEENDAWALSEIPNYAEELAKCQRYYQKIGCGEWFKSFTTISGYLATSFKIPMRTTPSLSLTETSVVFYGMGADANVVMSNIANSEISATNTGVAFFNVSGSVDKSLVVGKMYACDRDFIAASADL